MDEIFDTLVQEIEDSAFPRYYAKGEYRRKQHCAEEHMQWLEEHLDDEAKAHLAQARAADIRIEMLEREAMVRLALAMGIRLALPC